VSLSGGAASRAAESASGQHGHEGCFPAAGGVEAVGFLPELDEDILHGVLGLGARAQQPADQRPDQSAVALEALLDGFPIASGDPRQQRIGLGRGCGMDS
jgi:hypothetical protein